MDSRYDVAVPASTLEEIPGDSKLTSITFIRIFAEGSGYFMVSSDYEASGKLGSQSLRRVKAGGETLSSRSEMRVEQPRYVLPDLAAYGIPDQLNLSEPFLSTHIAPSRSAPAEVLAALVRRYDFDRFLRVDTFHGN